MGADLLLACLVIDTGTEPDWEAAHKAIDDLPREDDNVDKVFAALDLDPEEPLALAEAKDHLKAQLKIIQQLVLEDRRDTSSIRVRGATVYITGGMSWGDSPNEVCDAVWDMPEPVLAAAGFDV